ncbi:hypothetical protein P700755_001940 [Psychroflexus torquis ATCC 700755]|uniref:Uncharacterized protein n=2 Tax=Psychroflexus TaxID=83612 RepID=K4IFZ9_PSYTT|nr:hypothetical protein P700755_001940 [Psychroflexus torquis ATCC 700755]
MIASLILFGINSYSQNSIDEPQNVIVNWEVGTSKSITQIDSTIIHAKDSIFMATGVSSSYTMKILSLKDTVYELLFKHIVLDDNISIESEMINASPIEKMMQDLILELQKKMSGLEYSFLVDQNTALAYEVKNEKELRELVEGMVVVVLNKFLDKSKTELDELKKNEIQLKVKQYMDEQMPAAMQTMINAFNYIFQAYSFPFIIDKTYTQDVEVYSVDQVQHSDKDSKAKLVVNSSIKDDLLEIDYEYIYNKEEAYQMYVVNKGNGNEIPINDFDIDERVISEFDMETSWIKSSLSLVNAKMGFVTVNNKTQVIIK